MNKVTIYAALWLLTSSAASFAADMPLKAPPPPPMPMSGFFIGLGGSYNSVKFEQDMFGAVLGPCRGHPPPVRSHPLHSASLTDCKKSGAWCP